MGYNWQSAQDMCRSSNRGKPEHIVQRKKQSKAREQKRKMANVQKSKSALSQGDK
jgi:hypothetical protein